MKKAIVLQHFTYVLVNEQVSIQQDNKQNISMAQLHGLGTKNWSLYQLDDQSQDN